MRLGVCCVALLLHCGAVRCAVEPFTFVHITDTHIGVTSTTDFLRETLRDIDRTFPQAEFIVHTGDVTDLGYRDEYTSYVETIAGSKRKIYHVPGNHDSRWSENGKENYKQALGNTYTRFDHKGVRFILMDVSLLLQHYAHFDGVQLRQLEAELAAMPPGMSAIVGMHHPPLSDGRYFDNDNIFGEIIRRFNVPLVLDGHGHALKEYRINNTLFTMGGTTMNKGRDKFSYRVVAVTSSTIAMSVRNWKAGETTVTQTIPATRTVDMLGEVTFLGAGAASRSRGRELAFRLDRGKTKVTTGSFTLDNVTTGLVTFGKDGRFRVPSELKVFGRRQLRLTAFDAAGNELQRTCFFEIKMPDSAVGCTVSGEFDLKTGTLASPLVLGDRLFIGANDYVFRCFDLKSRRVIWERKLGAENVSSAVAAGDTVVVGCNDGYVYSFRQSDGEKMWNYKAGGAVMATPLVVGDMIYVGAGDYKMHALRARTGERVWTFTASKLIKVTPAVAGDNLVFGAWDNQIYAVNRVTGALVWRVPAGTSPVFSAATSNPATTGTRVVVQTHDYHVRCLDSRNGAHFWMHNSRADELGPSYSSPVFWGNIAISGSIKGSLVGHDVATGDRVIDVPLGGQIQDPVFDSTPAIDGDVAYIGTVGGNVYAVDLRAKKVLWRVALQPGFIFSKPVLANGKLYVSSMGGRVFEVTLPR